MIVLDAIVDFFKGIGTAITSVVDFVIGLFQDLVYMIKLLGQVVLNIPKYFSWLPAEIIALVVLLISIVVIYKILGREG